jgi:hypothetical protein
MNDDLFPKPTSSAKLRALLRTIDGADEQLLNDTRYQAGFQDGLVMGRMEAEAETKCLIRALMKLYDTED